MKFKQHVVLHALVVALAASASAGASVIDTGLNVNANFTSFGSPNTATYGQTFTATDTYLNNFSLYLISQGGGTRFKGYIAGWDGTRATTILYSSVMRTTGAGGLEKFAFDTGSLKLSTGGRYIAFLSVSEFSNMPLTHWMPRASSAYLPGDFAYFNNGSDFRALTSQRWDCTGCGYGDIAFKATLSRQPLSVPEPASLALVALGLAGAGLIRRRTRRA